MPPRPLTRAVLPAVTALTSAAVPVPQTEPRPGDGGRGARGDALRRTEAEDRHRARHSEGGPPYLGN